MIFPLLMTIVALTFLLCLLCGVAWTANRRIPVIATDVILGGYLVFVVALGIRAAQCWECGGLTFAVSVALGWMVPAALVGAVFFGVTANLFVDAATTAHRWQARRTR